MRRMSFALTTDQVRARLKTVTRRLGWKFLKPGDRLLAVDKIRTSKAQVLGVIEVVDVRTERLEEITQEDVIREGYHDRSPTWFVFHFVAHVPGSSPSMNVQRIEFKYVEESA